MARVITAPAPKRVNKKEIKVKKVTKSTKTTKPTKIAAKKAVKAKVPKTAAPKQKIIQKKLKVQKKGPLGYTPAEYQKYQAQKKRVSGFSNQTLKDMLKKNLQSMSGNKDELVEKVADGIVLGRIPRCPKCFGGRPKYNLKTGTYHCSGYRDDQDFKNCHTNFTKQQLKRDPWQ